MGFFSRQQNGRSTSTTRTRATYRPRVEKLEDRKLMTAGALDLSFGTGGKVIKDYTQIDPNAGSAAARAVFVYPSSDLVNAGKVLSGGALGLPNVTNTGSDFALLRYNSDGTPDQTFGTGGMVTTDFNSLQDVIYALAVDRFGRIVVAGNATRVVSRTATGAIASTAPDFALARYTADGNLDTDINTGFGPVDPATGLKAGKLTTVNGSNSIARAISILPDNKLLVGGYAHSGTANNADFALARYNEDGALDVSFGNSGLVTTPIGAGSDYARSMVVQGDGKIVLGGSAYSGTDYDFAAARYNANGSLDSTFGTGGKVMTPIGVKIAKKGGFVLTDDSAAIALDASGRVLLAGYTISAVSGLEDTALVRYTANGVLDATFGSGGKVVTDLGGRDMARAMVLQPDGKIVVAGSATSSTTGKDFALTRYTSNGTLDSSFGTGGKVTTVFNNGPDEAIGMALQADGKIVASGYMSVGFAFVRYLGDSPAVPTNVMLAAVSSSQINLRWTETSTNVSSFFIERSTDGVNFTQVAVVGSMITSYSDTGLSPLTKYYYRLRASNANGVSLFSQLVSQLTLAS